MTTPLAPPVLIEPPVPPVAQYGLLNAAVGPMPLPSHGIAGGVQYQADVCTDARLYQAVCDPTPQVKIFDGQDPLTTALPFVVYASLICGTAGYTLDELSARVQRRLAVKEQPAVESALWGVAGGDTPGYFQSGVTVTALPDAAGVTAALAALEQALATCYDGIPGIIHARPRVAAHMSDHTLLLKENGLIKTWRGNAVVFGDGYSGRDPAGALPGAATDEFLYATGRVLIWRSEDVFVPDPRQTLDRTTNHAQLIAERNYALAVECCLFVIKATGVAA